jgi:ribose 5-phosphate isomerase B
MADHGGFVLKTSLIPWLESQNYEIVYLGAYIFDSTDDYPDFAEELAEAISSGKEKNIGLWKWSRRCYCSQQVSRHRAGLCHDTSRHIRVWSTTI